MVAALCLVTTITAQDGGVPACPPIAALPFQLV